MIRCPSCGEVMRCKRGKVQLGRKNHHVTICRCSHCGFDTRENMG